MKPVSTIIEFADGKKLRLIQSDRDTFGPDHTQLYILKITGFRRRDTVAVEDLEGYCRMLGSHVHAGVIKTNEDRTCAWLLTLERSPNGRQCAAFLETLYEKIFTREAV